MAQKMTLSERFRNLQAQALSREQSSLVSGIGSQQPVRGSLRNQNLANQLANRPAVQAALRLKNRSIKQRLGIRTRLGPPVSRLNPYIDYGADYNNMKPSVLAMDQEPVPRAYSLNQNNNRFGGWRRFGRGNFRPYFGQRRFPFQPRMNNTNNGFNKWFNPKFARTGFKSRNRNRGFRGGRGGQNNNNNNFWRNNRRKPNREQLDQDIDQYMSKTRNSLNEELDVYMSQINSS